MILKNKRSIPQTNRYDLLHIATTYAHLFDLKSISQYITNKNVTNLTLFSKDFMNSFLLGISLSGCLVDNPEEADLYMIPFSIHTNRIHDKYQNNNHLIWSNMFKSLQNYQQLFHHFNELTAKKHVLFSSSYGMPTIVGKGIYLVLLHMIYIIIMRV